MIANQKNLVLIFIFFITTFTSIFSQIENYQLSGVKKDYVDTLAFETTQKNSKETVCLMEKEIDPVQYVLGPNDVLTISIISYKVKQYDTPVSPEGKILVPEVGVIDVKNLTLANAEILIKEKINKSLKNDEIFVVLKSVRQFKVTVSGKVRKAAIVPASAVDRASEVIDRAGGFMFNSSLRNIKILRDNKSIAVDLVRYFILGAKEYNPFLMGGDIVVVSPVSEHSKIEIKGEVASPGSYEYIPGDSLSTIIRFAQGFLVSSFLDSIEIVRFKGNSSQIEHYYVNLNSWPLNCIDSLPLPGDIQLQAGDRIYVRKIPDWHVQSSIAIAGEVNYKGSFAINNRTTRVYDVLEQSGISSTDASLDAAFLIRKKELNKIDPVMERLSKTSYNDMSESERRYYQSRISEQKGVMATNFNKILKDPKSDDNIVLTDEDSIFVPQKRNFINVQGRVNNPGMVIFKPGFSYEDYIELAGGYGFRADRSQTLVVKSKGQQFLAKDKNYILEEGDYILVPPESEVKFIDVFTSVLTITTQLVTVFGVLFTIVRLTK